jgi:hypothetical protein
MAYVDKHELVEERAQWRRRTSGFHQIFLCLLRLQDTLLYVGMKCKHEYEQPGRGGVRSQASVNRDVKGEGGDSLWLMFKELLHVA